MTIEVLVRGAADAPAVFLLSGDPAREAGLRARLSERALSLVRLSVPDWNADLSPWPAPPAATRSRGAPAPFWRRCVRTHCPVHSTRWALHPRNARSPAVRWPGCSACTP